MSMKLNFGVEIELPDQLVADDILRDEIIDKLTRQAIELTQYMEQELKRSLLDWPINSNENEIVNAIRYTIKI